MTGKRDAQFFGKDIYGEFRDLAGDILVPSETCRKPAATFEKNLTDD